MRAKPTIDSGEAQSVTIYNRLDHTNKLALKNVGHSQLVSGPRAVISRSPSEAESAFYTAFRNGDHIGMMAVWATNSALVCVHPMGPRLESWDQISASWEKILASDSQRLFEIRLKASWEETDISVRIVDELISVPTRGLQFAPVIATNVYRYSNNGWHMVAHHASVDATRYRDIRDEEPAHTHH